MMNKEQTDKRQQNNTPFLLAAAALPFIAVGILVVSFGSTPDRDGSALRPSIDKVSTELVSVKDYLEGIKESQSGLSSQLDEISAKIDSVAKKLDSPGSYQKTQPIADKSGGSNSSPVKPKWINHDGRSLIDHIKTVHGGPSNASDAELIQLHDSWHDAHGGAQPAAPSSDGGIPSRYASSVVTQNCPGGYCPSPTYSRPRIFRGGLLGRLFRR